MNSIDSLVIGSGPSGAIAAMELLDQGRDVVLIDNSELSNAGEAQLLLHIALGIESKQRKILLDDVESYFNSKSEIVRKKIKFGQDIRDKSNGAPCKDLVSAGLSSKAKGGFTEIWGAVVNIPKSIKNISFSQDLWKELAETLSEVLSEVPFTQDVDVRLPFGFHLYAESKGKLFETPLQKRVMNRNASRHSLTLANLAVKTSGQNSCFGCEKCMMGCPADAIYSSRMLVDRLVGRGLDYRNGYKVLKLEEIVDGVLVTASINGQVSTFRSNRVFVAAGPIASAEIVSKSVALKSPIKFKDTPIVYGVHFAWRTVNQNRNQSMCEIILDKSNLQNGIYSQFYTLERTSLGIFLGSGGFFAKFLKKVALFFRRFLVVSISYLPQESDFEFGAKLIKTGSRSKIKKTKSYFSGIVMSFSELIQVGIIAPPAIFIFAEMGSSMHFGSSFPPGSVSDSQANVSDEYGRVYGMQRIHLIDGSVLPNIIVGPPTLTIMANSMRIVRRVLSHLD